MKNFNEDIADFELAIQGEIRLAGYDINRRYDLATDDYDIVVEIADVIFDYVDCFIAEHSENYPTFGGYDRQYSVFAEEVRLLTLPGIITDVAWNLAWFYLDTEYDNDVVREKTAALVDDGVKDWRDIAVYLSEDGIDVAASSAAWDAFDGAVYDSLGVYADIDDVDEKSLAENALRFMQRERKHHIRLLLQRDLFSGKFN